MLAIVVAVQQLEGNVLQPIIQGRGLNLHAGVVILAVTAGSSLAGIIGAFLSVPVAALIAVAYRYGRDLLDGLTPEVAADGTTAQFTGDASGSQLVRRPAETEPSVNPDSEDAGRPDAVDDRRGIASAGWGMPAPTAPSPLRTTPTTGGPTVPQRPEDLVELLPEAEPLLAREAAVSSPDERARAGPRPRPGRRVRRRARRRAGRRPPAGRPPVPS